MSFLSHPAAPPPAQAQAHAQETQAHALDTTQPGLCTPVEMPPVRILQNPSKDQLLQITSELVDEAAGISSGIIK